MSATDSISNTDKLNYINMGLILLSCAVAFFIPFELFLFSYAILGPAHYLTEISWLHERKYFSSGKRDYIFLGIAGIILFLLVYVTLPLKMFDLNTNTHLQTGVVYITFIASFAMVVLKKPFHRFIAFLVIIVTVVITKNTSAVLFFSVFLPTLIHVFIFTALFMLYGALKSRSKSGYLSVLLLLSMPFVFYYFTPAPVPLSHYAMETYPMFHVVNLETIHLFNSNLLDQFNPPVNAIYQSTLGITVMRFIAFAYTYHYLNWFSKTTIIKWHLVPKKRLAIISVLWIASIAFYIYDYKLGFNILFLLSFLHVFLEFPLNHVTFIGIFKELGAIISGNKTMTPVREKKK